MTNSILALVVKVIAASAPLNPECLWGLESSQRLIEPGRDARSDSVQLMDQNRCRWNLVSQEAGAAVLWRFDSLERPVEIEIAAALDGERGTALNIALLDSVGRVLRSAPYTSFRERQGALRIRFVLTLEDTPGYLLAMGATDAPEVLFRRVFRSASSKTLSFIGLETGLDSTADIRSSPNGSFVLQVKQHRPLRP